MDNSMKRICMITSVHRNDDIRIYHKEAKALARAGYRVYIVSPNACGRDDLGIRFIKSEMPRNRLMRIATAWHRVLKVAESIKADVYHIHDPELLPLAWILKKHGAKVIYDAHEDTTKQILSKPYLPLPMRKPLSIVYNVLEKEAVKALDVTVCVTQKIADKFGKTAIIHNYPCLEEFLNVEQSPPEYRNRPRQVCYLGAISKSRGIEQILETSKLINGRIALAGATETAEIKKTLEIQSGRIRYLGVLDRLDAVRLLNHSRVGLLILAPTPNYRESLPIKLFEYMMAGIPVVASDFESWRKMGFDVCTLFVNPYHPVAIAEAVNYLLDNPDIAEKMGEAGKRLVLKEFAFKNEELKLLDVYKELTGGL